MGWAAAALGLAAGMALWLAGFPVRRWPVAAAALMLAAAGLAWQGEAFRPGAPAAPRAGAAVLPPAENGLRDAMIDTYTADGAYLVASDAMARIGEPRIAVRVILGGIGKYPQSHILWSELGSALAAYDCALSPPARFAFARAIALAPRHPAPRFRLGLAQLEAGDVAAARRSWQQALALAPARAGYHRDIAVRIALLDVFAGMRR